MSDIKWVIEDIQSRRRQIALCRAYYDGEHRLAFATEKWDTAFGRLFSEFSDNLCPAVVDSKADRLQVSGFSAKTDAVSNKAQDIWVANRMPLRSGQVHTGALRDGDAFIIVWPAEDGMPRFYPQRADRMAIDWSDEEPGLVEMAGKVWPQERDESDSKWRLNLYYPDRIEKYITRDVIKGGDLPTKDESWMPYGEEEDALGGTLNRIENQYGVVPVFAFCNNAPTGEYGKSELHDVIPLQDALNKTLADMLVAGEFAALPQRWATGLEVPVGPDGQPTSKPFEAGVDRIWSTGNENARFGQFDPANMVMFVSVEDSFRAEIARVSRTPLHYLLLSGTFPSGEALRAAEAPLMAVVKDRQLAYGASWEDAMDFALLVAGVKEAEGLALDWEDTTTQNEKEHVDTLAVKQTLKVPVEQLWREMGYDSEQIKDFSDAAADAAVEAQAQLAAGIDSLAGLPGFGQAAPPMAALVPGERPGVAGRPLPGPSEGNGTGAPPPAGAVTVG